MSDGGTAIDAHEFDPVASKSHRVSTIMSCFSILGRRKISSSRFLIWDLESFCRLWLPQMRTGAPVGAVRGT